MVEVTVARLGIDSSTNSYVVILREKEGSRLLPIWIGRPEAESIAMQMNEVKQLRPQTHDLCKALITSLGGTLRRVTITRVHLNTYFAEMHVECGQGWVQIDARPSDSIAIALRFDAPIFADDSLLNTLESDDDDNTPGTDPLSTPVTREEMSPEQLKAYLATLRPEDFGKFTP